MNGLKILIVEDEEPMAQLLEKLVKPLRQHFPNSEVILANRMEQALSILSTFPSPDVMLLDLTLPDSTLEQTIAKIDQIEGQCPVVLVTGHAREKVLKLLGRDIPIVEKAPAMLETNILVRVIVKAVEVWQASRWSRITRNLNRMKEIANAPEAI
jgi:CheY-like chemotaxis protein